MLGAPNSASIPTTQICFPPHYLQNIILFTKDLVFVVSIAIQRFWRYGSLYLDLSWYHFFFLGFNEFHVSDKKPITDLSESAPPSLGSSFIQYNPISLFIPSLCMTAVELVCTVGFFTRGAFFFFIQKKKVKKLLA